MGTRVFVSSDVCIALIYIFHVCEENVFEIIYILYRRIYLYIFYIESKNRIYILYVKIEEYIFYV